MLSRLVIDIHMKERAYTVFAIFWFMFQGITTFQKIKKLVVSPKRIKGIKVKLQHNVSIMQLKK